MAEHSSNRQAQTGAQAAQGRVLQRQIAAVAAHRNRARSQLANQQSALAVLERTPPLAA